MLKEHFLDFTLDKENEESEGSEFKQESSDESEANQDDGDLQEEEDGSKKSGRKKYVRKTQMCPVCGKLVVSLKSHSYIHTVSNFELYN